MKLQIIYAGFETLVCEGEIEESLGGRTQSASGYQIDLDDEDTAATDGHVETCFWVPEQCVYKNHDGFDAVIDLNKLP